MSNNTTFNSPVQSPETSRLPHPKTGFYVEFLAEKLSPVDGVELRGFHENIIDAGLTVAEIVRSEAVAKI